MLRVEKLSYSYPDGTRALKDISFEIAAGDSVAFIGPNGAGKSTLLLTLNGILEAQGHIEVNGLTLGKENFGQIRHDLGLVFQEPDHQLFMPTVFDDVAFGPLNMGLKRDEVSRRVKEALATVDMLSDIHRPSHHLSYGEKKRISIATVLSMSPKILAMDEPTSNLDPKHRRDIIELLKRVSLTRIIATHDLELVLEVSQKVFVLNKGQIIASGNPKTLLADEALMRQNDLEVPYSLNKR